MTTLPKIDRRAWLAIWLQERRRARAAAAPVVPPEMVITLDGNVHGFLTWTYSTPSVWPTNIYYSADGVTWGHTFDAVDAGETSRDCSGVAGYFRICQADFDGADIAPFSNVVQSDGAPAEMVITLGGNGSGLLTWTYSVPSAWPTNIYYSADGVTWDHTFDTADPGDTSRDCSGIAGYFRICQADFDGNDIAPFSNVVHSDGA